MPIASAASPCPLCDSAGGEVFHRDPRREYLRCRVCALVYVPPEYHLDASAEKAEYDLHQNAPRDPGYRRFLSRLLEPMLAAVPVNARGLDFGCGPGPALAQMFEEQGRSMALYDPYYADHPEVLQRRYDFITASEVVEHLRRPGDEFQRLWSSLKPGGRLGVMTQMVLDRDAFSRWRYKNDPTHISFFCIDSFRWLAARLDATMNLHGRDVVVLLKPG